MAAISGYTQLRVHILLVVNKVDEDHVTSALTQPEMQG